MPGQSTMFVLLMSCNLARSACEREANGLAYSRCPVNTNDLATPRARTLLLSSFWTAISEGKLSTCRFTGIDSVWCSIKNFLSNMGGKYHCEWLLFFILIQVLYLVGVLLMTFDLLTCAHSQGSGFLPVYSVTI